MAPSKTGSTAPDDRSAYLLAEAKRRDPDRFLCALFAPAERRDDLLALLLFNDELARIPDAVTQPVTGLIRLQWWRDALDELLTGRPPYLGNNNFEVLYGHKNTPPPDASELVPEVPPGVADVLIHGLAKRRDDRLVDVLQFIAELDANAGVKKVDLARAFDVSHPERTRVTRGTRAEAKPPPAIAQNMPIASNSDVHSAGGEEQQRAKQFGRG